MTLEEKQELIKSATTEEELEARMKQIEDDKEEIVEDSKEEVTEEVEKKSEEISKEEERSLIADTEDLETRSVNTSKLTKIGGNEKMEERKFTTASPEYRSAWAKTLMGVKLDETEERALGDAVGTTATEFTASAANTQGINNLGLLIPDSVKLDWLKIAEKASPIYRDIRKLNINGNVDFPYLFGADDAEWYAEMTTTKNEGQEYKNIKLTGHELAKAIEITWKAEAMTVEGFISFLLDELNEKMNKALINAVIYGDGSGKPTGITNGLTAKTNAKAIELIKACLGALDTENRVGAKVYVASNVADEIAFYKDENGNYPYLVAGLGRAGGATIEADPFLHAGDIVVGNAQNYILNFNEGLRVDKEIKVQPRRVVYGGYLIADGNKKPNSFVYGKMSV
ncbi:phage major capsid protein [Faecalibacillus faecis]|uniref:phage major capsid protein n=1 Tax=Faecalibacillus faecis TaxID=1982628 RepID=UPI00386CA5EF